MDANIERSAEPKQPEKSETKEVNKAGGKFKNFLLAFFIAEHIIIFLILLIPAFFMVRAYAFSDFGKLNEKASNFTPGAKGPIMKSYTDKYINYFTIFMNPEDIRPKFDFEFKEEDINSFFSDLKLEHINKFYLDFDNDNTVNLWVKVTEIPYPLMFKTRFSYNLENTLFELKILDWQIGPLSFPASILSFVEETLNKDAWEKIAKITDEASANIVSMESTDGLFRITVEITDKTAFVERIFSGSSFELPTDEN